MPRTKSVSRNALALVLIFALVLIARPLPAPACDSESCPNCVEDDIATTIVEGTFLDQFTDTQTYINLQFTNMQNMFWNGYFWYYHVLNGLQNMAQQLTTAGMLEMGSIGLFFDASESLQRQRLMQQKAAEAHKDYQSSMEMCSFGSTAGGLGNGERRGQINAQILGRRSIDRQMNAIGVSATAGSTDDLNARLKLFKQRYCDVHDNNDGLAPVCNNVIFPTQLPPTHSISAGTTSFYDKDINFTRTILQPAAIHVDFTDNMLRGEELDVVALGNNLFAHNILSPVPPSLLAKPGNQEIVLDMRSVVAKRSVAENSYYALVGMKSAAEWPANVYFGQMHNILMALGVGFGDSFKLMNNEDILAPSYDSTMEFLTKTIEEDPVFYTNLYDTPANVARKGAALRAIDLMQHMDMFKSRIRNEAILAELVELDVDRLQKQIQDAMDRMRKQNGK